MIYGEPWEKLAREHLGCYLMLIEKEHGTEYGLVKPHRIATKPETCIYCQDFVEVLMLLQGMKYEKN